MTSAEIPFHSILIYGMGMMGSSLSLALKDSVQFKGRVDGIVKSGKSEKFIKEHGICDNIFRIENPEELKKIALADYDLIVIGLPVGNILDMVEFFPSYEGIITDMSSTHVKVAEAFRKRSDLNFIGSHPMCGSEEDGPSAAKHDLFYNRLCILLENFQLAKNGKISGQKMVDSVASLWQGIGMKTYRMDEKVHDEVLAFLSHGPHLLSGLIARWAHNSHSVIHSNASSPIPISGGGFRDMVRIAGSNKKMWTDILETNREFIRESLRLYRDDLDELIRKMDSFDRDFFLDWFSGARKARNILCGLDEED